MDESLAMSNGEKVWVQIRQAELSAAENEGVASVEREWPVLNVTSHEAIHQAWGLWVTTGRDLEVPLLTEMPLGRRQFRTNRQAR